MSFSPVPAFGTPEAEDLIASVHTKLLLGKGRFTREEADVLLQSHDALRSELAGEKARRIKSQERVRKLREITQDKRDLLSIAEGLQDELERRETRSIKWLENALAHQTEGKRRLTERFKALREGLAPMAESLPPEVRKLAYLDERNALEGGGGLHE